MNVYRLLRFIGIGRIPDSLKVFGVWLMYVSRRRMAAVFIDPVMACNLRCRMCYFSDPEKRASMSGTMADEELDQLERSMLPYAVKMQIGCGAEPTLYGRLVELVERGKRCGVPYISLTTNGQLLASGRVRIGDLVEAGLDEITLSMHGTDARTYEYLMPGAKFEMLKKLISDIAEIRKRGLKLSVRVNFTVNNMNMRNLEGNGFWQLWDDAGILPDIVQLRPVQRIGDSDWSDFDLEPLKEHFDATIGNVVRRCREEKIVCIAPTAAALDEVATDREAVGAIIEDVVYCYVSPGTVYKPDFDRLHDTFYTYNKKHHTGWHLFKTIFRRGRRSRPRGSKKLNYTVR